MRRGRLACCRLRRGGRSLRHEVSHRPLWPSGSRACSRRPVGPRDGRRSGSEIRTRVGTRQPVYRQSRPQSKAGSRMLARRPGRGVPQDRTRRQSRRLEGHPGSLLRPASDASSRLTHLLAVQCLAAPRRRRASSVMSRSAKPRSSSRNTCRPCVAPTPATSTRSVSTRTTPFAPSSSTPFS